jgi:hypothetical protein
VSVRKTLPILLLTTALAFSGAACGDKTVTTSSAGKGAPVTTPAAPSGAASVDAAVDTAEVDLTEVDQLLRDIEADLSAVDKDASTPEGDPTL